MMLNALIGSGGGGGGPHLIPDLATFLQTLVLFSVLVGVLWKFAWPGILKALEEREHHIKDEIERAEKNRAESEKLLKTYEAKLEAARAEAQKMIDEGKADATRLKDQILKEAREEAEKTVARAKREIELAGDKAAAELRERTVEIAIQAAGRILAVPEAAGPPGGGGRVHPGGRTGVVRGHRGRGKESQMSASTVRRPYAEGLYRAAPPRA